ncbi:MAG: hypothetical protein N2738_03300 [Thermodesulfovibrionales bacterium]|nr:hypothetical protein [Thermodesulfovibrionales bacterium]
MTEIGEGISVIATFGMPYKMKPIRFKWSGRLFEIKEITYQWVTKEGIKTIYHFSVTDGSSLYEIAFDSHSLIWKLERLEADR